MDPKTTQELINELKNADNVSCFLSSNDRAMDASDLRAYLEKLLSQKGCSKKDAITRSGLHEIYAYQIFSGKKTPSRDKILALCLGMQLTMEESQHLLNKAGVAELYPRRRRDSIILFALKKNLSVMACNELLYEMKEHILQ